MDCIIHAIKCREGVLADLAEYEVDEIHRPQLEENLEYFKNKLKELEGKINA